VLLAALVTIHPALAHLLVTEVGYDTVDETSPTSEFVEIMNPDGAGVALGDFWLVGDEDAYPYLVNGPVSGVSLNGFIYRFPTFTLGPGKVAVICQDSDAFFAEHFPGGGLGTFLAQAGNPVLFEVTQDGSADGVPDMIPWGSNPAGTLSMANNGECVGLAYWDGASDRVVDHDWVCWLTTNYIPNKDVDYPLGIDGPDPDLDPSWFAEDRANGLPAPDAPQGFSIHRTSLAEKDEVASGGNGAGGHDETSEDWSVWQIGAYSPGRQNLTSVAGVGPTGTPNAGLALGPCAPSPFMHEVRLSYATPTGGRVRLTIHDLRGRSIATLVDGEEPAGTRVVTWDGTDRAGRMVASGIYFVRLECGGLTRSLRIARTRE
jgi:hypothetical protein